MRGVLRDESLDRRLRRDGFVTFPLFSREEVADLREQFGLLRGWEHEGFHSDLVLDEPDYRRKVSEVISTALDDKVIACFEDYHPFLRNFLCKFPGEESSLYLHRDWMYVDERRGARTYVAWVALEDITGHNGQLRVLRGSHTIDPSLRGTQLIAPWLEHTDVIEPRLLSVPVRAGEVIVFDNALVHSSYPNLTDEPRVAAAVGMRPAASSLVHLRAAGPGRATRYDVDEEFFCTATPQGLIAAPPELPVAEVVPDHPAVLSAGELAGLLDRGRYAKVDRAQQAITRASRRATAAARSVPDHATAARQWLRDRRPAIPERGQLVERLRSTVAGLPQRAAVAVLTANEAMIDRFGPDTPAVWDPSEFEWSSRVEAAWPAVRAEVEALLAGPTEIPHIEDVTGGIPQGNVGPWRSFVLMHQGRWIDWNCERCPDTTALVRSIPGLTVAGFSVLEPGTHITTHRGPNKGALRYQLGVIVPGSEGDCRIRVGDEMIHWREGEGVVFDFTVEHEAWNDTDAIRVLLMLEFLTPLPWYIAAPNWVAQHAMSWFPTTRDLTDRLRKLEPDLARTTSV